MIIGNRLRLRAIEREDIPRFVKWLNDPEVREHISLVKPLSIPQEEKWYENLLLQPAAEHPLVIERLSDGNQWEPIGNIGFMDINWINRSTEFGIFIGDKSCWSHGYGREAIELLIRYGFNTLNMNRIYLRVDETNLRGIRCYEHAGFIHEGRQRQAKLENGQYIDLLMMSILRSEWQARQSY
jgi:diamine N-acetyltransferase